MDNHLREGVARGNIKKEEAGSELCGKERVKVSGGRGFPSKFPGLRGSSGAPAVDWYLLPNHRPNKEALEKPSERVRSGARTHQCADSEGSQGLCLWRLRKKKAFALGWGWGSSHSRLRPQDMQAEEVLGQWDPDRNSWCPVTCRVRSLAWPLPHFCLCSPCRSPGQQKMEQK